MEKNTIPVVSSPVSAAAETEIRSTAGSSVETTTTITEVHNEVAEEQRDEKSSFSEEEEPVTAGTEADDGEAVRTEAAVSSDTQERYLTDATEDVTEAVVSDTTTVAETTLPAVSETEAVTETTDETIVSEDNGAVGGAAFLLVGAVGAAAAAGAFMHFKKKKSPGEADEGLSAKERDAARLNKGKKKKPKKKVVKKKRTVPRTTQKTIPYLRVCDDYIFLVDENKYSKTYKFEDVNYAIAKQEEQEGIFLGYCSVLNSFDTNAEIQITVHNNRVNKADFDDMVLLKHKGDSFDHYIDVYNKMLVEKMEQGQNGIIRNDMI